MLLKSDRDIFLVSTCCGDVSSCGGGGCGGGDGGAVLRKEAVRLAHGLAQAETRLAAGAELLEQLLGRILELLEEVLLIHIRSGASRAQRIQIRERICTTWNGRQSGSGGEYQRVLLQEETPKAEVAQQIIKQTQRNETQTTLCWGKYIGSGF